MRRKPTGKLRNRISDSRLEQVALPANGSGEEQSGPSLVARRRDAVHEQHDLSTLAQDGNRDDNRHSNQRLVAGRNRVLAKISMVRPVRRTSTDVEGHF
jgi:hypothetical protein